MEVYLHHIVEDDTILVTHIEPRGQAYTKKHERGEAEL